MNVCLIWGTPANVESSSGGFRVESSRSGGDYRITCEAATIIEDWEPRELAKLTTWLVDQRRVGEARPMIDGAVLARVRMARRIKYSEKKRRLFLWISHVGLRPHQDIAFGGVQKPHVVWTLNLLAAWMECEHTNEVGAIMKLLTDEGLFWNRDNGRARLTSAGFEFLELVESGGAPTNQAFVAMWFTQEMNAVFDAAIAPAIDDAGYIPFRVDQKETINKIDDEIIAEIRRSRFVVADFTCGVFNKSGKAHAEARGGVYFEAGFAMGLNTPVIWTVRNDCVDYLHFDTQQFAHIVWSDPENLRTKLTNRIRAVIGQGPNVK